MAQNEITLVFPHTQRVILNNSGGYRRWFKANCSFLLGTHIVAMFCCNCGSRLGDGTIKKTPWFPLLGCFVTQRDRVFFFLQFILGAKPPLKRATLLYHTPAMVVVVRSATCGTTTSRNRLLQALTFCCSYTSREMEIVRHCCISFCRRPCLSGRWRPLYTKGFTRDTCPFGAPLMYLGRYFYTVGVVWRALSQQSCART